MLNLIHLICAKMQHVLRAMNETLFLGQNLFLKPDPLSFIAGIQWNRWQGHTSRSCSSTGSTTNRESGAKASDSVLPKSLTT